MIIEHEEKVESDFEGTIFDIETVGSFGRSPDSRRYKEVRQVILGYIDRAGLRIYCARDHEGVEELKKKTPEIIKALSRPFYAFNCEFESGVWFHHAGVEVVFDGELQSQRFEKKLDVVRMLRIPNYDDPFFDDGFKCLEAWNRNDFDKAVAHNRACLLKERDILLKRKCTQPHCLAFVR